ncbi:MAG: T9SS type A sorting domain-containing protein, partial [Bacteroidetes bacterium]|nr:T9SS type A sorting domain-containing protein [Bacteroidota bacterium]
KLSVYDIKMSKDALKLLVERTRYVYDSLGLPKPKTWIQPGGPCAQLNKQEVKELMGLEYGFTAGATYPTPSYKMYNEVDSLKNKRFAMQNLDINDESNYFQSLINIIADNTAKHTHSFTLSHFYNPIGGWDSYLGRTDSLLAWCKLNDIPIRNTNKWASIMFDSIPNPYVNVIPDLYTDLNYNGIPDGYTGPFADFDSTDGVTRSKGRSMSRSTNGMYYSINLLGGVEKGWNRLSMYTKGAFSTDSIRVALNMAELANSTKYYNLAANTTDWKEVSTMVYIDPKATRVTMQVFSLRGNNTTGLVKLSGVQLRKLSNIKVAKFKKTITADNNFNSIGINELVIDSAYSMKEFKTKIYTANNISATLDTVNGKVTIVKPSMFWVGIDSLKVVCQNGDNTSDSNYVYFESKYPSLCAGNKIILRSNSYYGSNFKWTDGSNEIVADSVTYTPTQSIWYKVQYKDKSNNSIFDSIYVMVDTQKPIITFLRDTVLCQNSSATFTISNSGSISWYDNSNKLLVNGNTLQLNSVKESQKLYIINKINSCESRDSIFVSVHPNVMLSQKIITKSVVKGNTANFDLVVPVYASVTLLNTPFNKFTYQNGIVLFDPKTNFIGKDSALFLVSDSKCAFDSIWLKVSVGNTSINQVESELVKIYPNPAKGDINIDVNSNGILSVYNLLGQLVMQSPFNIGKNYFNISSLNNCVYTLQLLVDDKVLIRTLVKE